MHKIQKWSSIIAASNFVICDKVAWPNAENISSSVRPKQLQSEVLVSSSFLVILLKGYFWCKCAFLAEKLELAARSYQVEYHKYNFHDQNCWHISKKFWCFTLNSVLVAHRDEIDIRYLD